MKNFIPKHVKFGYTKEYLQDTKSAFINSLSRESFKRKYPSCYKMINFYCSIMKLRGLKPLLNIHVISISNKKSRTFDGLADTVIGIKRHAILLPKDSDNIKYIIYWSIVLCHEDAHANLGIGVKHGEIKAISEQKKFEKFYKGIIDSISIFPKLKDGGRCV
jgi:hypothetical protein